MRLTTTNGGLALWVGVLLLSACISGTPQRPTKHYQEHRDGSPKLEMDMRDGLPHGRATRWHSNGVIAYQGYYVHGNRHGEFNYWDEEKRWLRLDEFDNGVLLWSTDDREKPPNDMTVTTHDEDEENLLPLWSLFQASGKPWNKVFPELSPDGRSILLVRFYTQAITIDDASVNSQAWQITGAYSFERLGVPAAYGYVAARIPRIGANLMRQPSIGRSTAEAGAHYDLRKDTRVRLGLMLPLANDNLEGYRASSLAMQHQPHDFVAAFPRSMALRSGASYSGDLSALTYRIDSGLDLAINAFGDDTFAMKDPTALVGTFGAGLGFGTRVGALSVQLARAEPLLDSGLSDSITTLSLSAQFRNETMWHSISLIAPIFADDASVVLSFSIALRPR